MLQKNKGVVYLIGAGPGDPELITVKGRRLIETCDAVIYDNLVANEFILALPDSSEKYYVGKRAGSHCFKQEGINALLVKLAKQGKRVARLKGGDPFVFGRGSEEARHLKENGVRFEVVSGVTSGVAALAYNGIPCTDRGKSSFVIFATGHKASDKLKSSVPWDWVAQAKGGTLVIYMGIGEMETIVENLLEGGMPPDTPAAVIERGTFPSQRVITADLKGLPKKARAEKIRPPAIIVVGHVIDLQSELDWYEEKSLSGVRVMITSPAGQAQEMFHSLRELGAEVLSYPTVATRAVDDPEGWKSLDAAKRNVKWLVFTSENGVRYFLDGFAARYGDIRRLAGFRIAAGGRSTAKALEEARLSVDLSPPRVTSAVLAERLVETEDFSGAAVIRIQGTLAGTSLLDRLAADGAEVHPLTVYEPHFPPWSDGLKSKLFDHPPRVIIFTSGASVEGFFANLREEEAGKLASSALIASIGPMTTKALQGRGLKVSVEEGQHTVPALVQAIADRIHAQI